MTVATQCRNELDATIAALIAERQLASHDARIQRIETHISVIILTDRYAYKFKKHLCLPFLDFSTLAQRRKLCHEEVRLNRRWAPDLYLGVERIEADDNRIVMHPDDHPRSKNGKHRAVDYAVKMRRFDELAQLDVLIASDKLTRPMVAALGCIVGHIHRQSPVAAPTSEFATPARIKKDFDDTLDSIKVAPEYLLSPRILSQLRERANRWHAELSRDMDRRRNDGRVRECHGDLHLANVAMVDGQPMPFDGIEFNDTLRWIDVINDIAFTCMDLERFDRADLANVFLNAYLEITGDYEGLRLLRYYKLYRLLVRMKVAALRLGQCSPSGSEFVDTTRIMQQYLRLANQYLGKAPPPQLIITHGLSGCGKTWFTDKLLVQRNLIRIRSDIERKRADDRRDAKDTYTDRAIQSVYDDLETKAARLLEDGFTVVVDATFLNKGRRLNFRKLAARLKTPFHILALECPTDILESRILHRQQNAMDASDATLEVLQRQIADHEELSENERDVALVVDGSDDTAINNAVNQCLRALNG